MTVRLLRPECRVVDGVLYHKFSEEESSYLLILHLGRLILVDLLVRPLNSQRAREAFRSIFFYGVVIRLLN